MPLACRTSALTPPIPQGAGRGPEDPTEHDAASVSFASLRATIFNGASGTSLCSAFRLVPWCRHPYVALSTTAFGSSLRSHRRDAARGTGSNSRSIDGILWGPTDTIGMNKFSAVALGYGSVVALKAFPRPARTDCRWYVSRCRRACGSIK
jgi:hypothetical protein